MENNVMQTNENTEKKKEIRKTRKSPPEAKAKFDLQVGSILISIN